MSKVFVVNNQHGQFASKQKEWVDGREPKLLFRSPHRDEAINLVFELSSKDIYLRAEAISVELDDKKQPVVEVTAELVPEPAPDTSPEPIPENKLDDGSEQDLNTEETQTATIVETEVSEQQVIEARG